MVLQQTAYGQNRHIGEGEILISHILDICDKLNIDGDLVTVYIAKAFNFIDNQFLREVL